MCSGGAKLYVNSREGQSLTVRIVEHGEVLGLSSLMADEAYPVTAETLSPSQVTEKNVSRVCGGGANF